jgi:hypothetical protein
MKFAAPLVLIALVPLAFVAPAQGEELLPFFAGNANAPLTAQAPSTSRPDGASPWQGLSMGTEVFAGSGMGKRGQGGFGGDLNIGYLKEFDTNVVVGVGLSSGYTPSFRNYGPRGYNFGMADLKVGYDMGKFMPYVTVGVGKASAALNGQGGFQGLDSVNTMFGPHGASTTLTRVGAGFDYEVNEHLRIGAEISTVQARGGFGPMLVPQPGALP